MYKIKVLFILFAFLLVSSYALALSDGDNFDTENVTGCDEGPEVSISPNVTLTYDSNATTFQLTGHNLEGSMEYAVDSRDNNIYQQQIPDDGTTTDAALDNVLADGDGGWAQMGANDSGDGT